MQCAVEVKAAPASLQVQAKCLKAICTAELWMCESETRMDKLNRLQGGRRVESEAVEEIRWWSTKALGAVFATLCVLLDSQHANQG